MAFQDELINLFKRFNYRVILINYIHAIRVPFNHSANRLKVAFGVMQAFNQIPFILFYGFRHWKLKILYTPRQGVFTSIPFAIDNCQI